MKTSFLPLNQFVHHLLMPVLRSCEYARITIWNVQAPRGHVAIRKMLRVNYYIKNELWNNKIIP